MSRLDGLGGRLAAWAATPVRAGAAPGRPGIRPVDVAAVIVVITAVELDSAVAGGPGQRPLNALAYAFGAVVAVPILVRHRWPREALIGCSLLLLLFYSTDRRNISPAPLLCLPLYDAAAAGALALAIIVPVFYMGVGFVLVGATTHQSLASLTSDFLPSVVVLLLAILLGDAMRSRRELAAETAQRLRLAAEERDAEGARRVAEERLRISAVTEGAEATGDRGGVHHAGRIRGSGSPDTMVPAGRRDHSRRLPQQRSRQHPAARVMLGISWPPGRPFGTIGTIGTIGRSLTAVSAAGWPASGNAGWQ